MKPTIMRTAVLSLATVYLLLGLSVSTPAEKPARPGAHGKDLELHRTDHALQDVRKNKKDGERLVQQILREIEKTDKALTRIHTVVSAKAGAGSVIAFPDVCRTPSPGSQASIPYPNVAGAADSSKGAKNVALLEHLRAVRAEVKTRYDFVAGICKKCKLRKADKRNLQQWLTATKKEVEQTRRSHFK
jgi:hypothetical protein